jgi:CYTH domain-containing protein
MAEEIENKYLLKFIPDFEELGIKPVRGRVRQGYFTISDNDCMRIRLIPSEGKAIVCLKWDTDKPIRQEFEYDVNYMLGLKMYEDCRWKVEKDTILFQLDDILFSIDTYDNGLQVIEAERDTLEFDASKYPFIGKCIDGVFEYTNYYLANYRK